MERKRVASKDTNGLKTGAPGRSYRSGARGLGSDATPSAELEYVSDRDGGFKRVLRKVQTADPLGLRVF